MEWLKAILEKAKIEDGKLDIDGVMSTVNSEFPKYAVPKNVFNDKVTELKTANKTIEDLKQSNADNAELQNKIKGYESEIETLKTDFISNVSHEIKTPLAVIQNTAELLKNDSMTPQQRQAYILSINEASKRLSSLITNILKLNKLEGQTIKPQSEPFDLCEQLCGCALAFEDIWEQKNIEFEAQLEDRLTLFSDAPLLEIVWNNILSNAFKFTNEGGRVTLRQWSDSNNAFIAVSDDGCGMSEETRRHIFDKFYQGDTSHSAQGNGLGLALAVRVLQLVDGLIEAESELGKGSTFTVKLPIKM